MFTPVFAQILDSSLMGEELETRWLFLTMLILGDEAQTGVVDMPLDRLAVRAGLSVEATARALERLKAPDSRSRGQDDDGRRIIPMPRAEGFEERGWILVNWEKYRIETQAGLRREAVRMAVMRHRHRRKGCVGCESCKPLDGTALSGDVNAGNHRVIKSKPSYQTIPDANQTQITTPPVSTQAPRKRVARAATFVQPTFDEVQAYIREKGHAVDPVAWFGHYTANGWKVGRNPMRDWKAAVITWTRRDRP